MQSFIAKYIIHCFGIAFQKENYLQRKYISVQLLKMEKPFSDRPKIRTADETEWRGRGVQKLHT